MILKIIASNFNRVRLRNPDRTKSGVFLEEPQHSTDIFRPSG